MLHYKSLRTLKHYPKYVPALSLFLCWIWSLCETSHPPIHATVHMSFFHGIRKISFGFDFVLEIYFLKNPSHNFFSEMGTIYERSTWLVLVMRWGEITVNAAMTSNFDVNWFLSHIPADKTYSCYWWNEFIDNTFLLIIRMLVITWSTTSCLFTQ